MKKINLSKFALSIVVLVSFNSLATTFSTENRICPIGGQKYTVELSLIHI